MPFKVELRQRLQDLKFELVFSLISYVVVRNLRLFCITLQGFWDITTFSI